MAVTHILGSWTQSNPSELAHVRLHWGIYLCTDRLSHKTELPNFIMLFELQPRGGSLFHISRIYNPQGNDHSYIDMKLNRMFEFQNMTTEKFLPQPTLVKQNHNS